MSTKLNAKQFTRISQGEKKTEEENELHSESLRIFPRRKDAIDLSTGGKGFDEHKRSLALTSLCCKRNPSFPDSAGA